MDVVAVPLQHDTPAEIAQTGIRDWIKGETEAIPGKTMPALKFVQRDYKNLYNQFISFGRKARENGIGAHGTSYAIDDFYDEMLEEAPSEEPAADPVAEPAADDEAAEESTE